MRRITKGIIGFTIARLFASGLLLWALAKHQYGYYTLLRFVVCGVVSFGVYLAGQYGKIGWLWTYLLIAVLFNPIIPIHLERSIWAIVDIGVALIILVSIFFVQGSKRGE